MFSAEIIIKIKKQHNKNVLESNYKPNSHLKPETNLFWFKIKNSIFPSFNELKND